jgi:hypothetical protein
MALESRAHRHGRCHLCGIECDRSKEHVPPKKAFNDLRSRSIKLNDWIRLGPEAVPSGPVIQGGISGYTLCEPCNNNTGHWYGNYFVRWCYQGMDILVKSGGNPRLSLFTYIFPLAIIKQIVTMFASVNSDSFGISNPELRDFVLNRDRRFLPPKYRFFVYYNSSNLFRHLGTQGRVRLDRGAEITFLSEIAYPPFGYVMTIDSEPPDERLAEITHFVRYGYGEFAVNEQHFPVLPVFTPYPGDYRTQDEIKKQGVQQGDNVVQLLTGDSFSEKAFESGV